MVRKVDLRNKYGRQWKGRTKTPSFHANKDLMIGSRVAERLSGKHKEGFQ
ncbi:MAG: hypothetical protein OEM27_04335 [Nitrospinota bacterium]|nr:hypothetical protein [Nitrospinota bacterium]